MQIAAPQNLHFSRDASQGCASLEEQIMFCGVLLAAEHVFISRDAEKDNASLEESRLILNRVLRPSKNRKAQYTHALQEGCIIRLMWMCLTSVVIGCS